MVTGWFLFNSVNDNVTNGINDSFFDAAVRLNIKLEAVNLMNANSKLESDGVPDFIIGRCLNVHDELFSFLDRAEKLGCLTFPSSYFLELFRDKWATHLWLVAQGIPVIKKTFLLADVDRNIVQGLGERFILKNRFGSKGEGVFLLSSFDEIGGIVGENVCDWIVQEFVEESSGRDIRVLTAGSGIFSVYERNNVESFKSNICCGGVRVFVSDPSEEVVSISYRILKNIDSALLGIDIMKSDSGFVVVECNSIPGHDRVEHSGFPYEVLKYIVSKVDGD